LSQVRKGICFFFQLYRVVFAHHSSAVCSLQRQLSSAEAEVARLKKELESSKGAQPASAPYSSALPSSVSQISAVPEAPPEPEQHAEEGAPPPPEIPDAPTIGEIVEPAPSTSSSLAVCGAVVLCCCRCFFYDVGGNNLLTSNWLLVGCVEGRTQRTSKGAATEAPTCSSCKAEHCGRSAVKSETTGGASAWIGVRCIPQERWSCQCQCQYQHH